MLVENKELNIDSSYERGLFILVWVIFGVALKPRQVTACQITSSFSVILKRSGKKSLAGFFPMSGS
jgi:hypothetical protein